MTPDRRVSIEWLVIAGILIAGAALRGVSPAVPPLTESEARHAILAAAEAGQPPSLAGMAAPGAPTDASYHALTALVFQGFGTGDGAARAVPMLAGALLLALPLLARRWLGRWETLVAILLFAVSPALTTVARAAGGRSLALLGISFAGLCLLDLWKTARPRPLVRWWPIGIGLAVCSGPAGWTALLIFALAGAGCVWMRQRSTGRWELPATEPRAWLAALGVILVLGSGLGFAPGGLRALASGFGAWLQGWGAPGVLAPYLLPVALLVYEPLCALIGSLHIGRLGRRLDDGERWLALWAAAGLIVPLVYPGREAADIVWSVVPLALLASREARVLTAPDEDSVTAFSRVAMVGVLLLLGAFAYLQIAAYLAGLAPGLDPLANPALSLLFGGIALTLGLIMLAFFALGWSREAAYQAGSQAAWVLLGLAMVAGIWRLNFDEAARHGGDLWRLEATSSQQVQLRATLAQVSRPTRSAADPVTLMAEGDVPASLVWTLRGLPITPSEGYQLAESPAVLLTPESGSLPLPTDYVGQTFTLSEHTAWGALLPSEAVTWWMRGTGPAQAERWIVLVRSDLASPDVIPAETP
jgi:hypothetical protein